MIGVEGMASGATLLEKVLSRLFWGLGSQNRRRPRERQNGQSNART
jgi:hypothetical protein